LYYFGLFVTFEVFVLGKGPLVFVVRV